MSQKVSRAKRKGRKMDRWMDRWMDRAEWILASLGIAIVAYFVVVFAAAIAGLSH